MKKIYFFFICLIFTSKVLGQCWKTVSVGRFSTFAIKTDGTLWACGRNSDNLTNTSLLGDGTTVDKNVFIKIGSDNNWQSIATLDYHTLAIKTDGSLWAWGSNNLGELGDGNFGIDKSIPTRIGSNNNWQYIAVGNQYSFAIKTDGSLWGWGNNFDGQLGDGTTINNKLIPTRIGSDNDWVTVVCNINSSNLAIKKNGSLWGWGKNTNGELGDGTKIPKTRPTRIGLDNNWKSVSMFRTVTALKTDNTLWGWGKNTNGELGDGTTTMRTTPIQIGSDNNWQEVVTGEYASSAIKIDGTLWGWGNNHFFGGFGDGTFEDSNVPKKIGTQNDWQTIKKSISSFAFKKDGSLWAWGYNDYGQLGDGTNIEKYSPILVNCTEIVTRLPKITLSKRSVEIGKTMIITGRDFTNSESVNLRFSGDGNNATIPVTADAQGRFTYTYTAPNSLNKVQNGLALVWATDVTTNQNTDEKPFYITSPTLTARSYLSIIDPTEGDAFQISRTINITWRDIMQPNYGGYKYPMQGNTSNRLYSYKVEYRVGSSGVWQTVQTVTGAALLNSTLTKTIPLVINTENASSEVRITDNYNNIITALSGLFSITPLLNTVQASMVWDYSFPKPRSSASVQGVAADGVSRIYIKVARRSTNTAAIQSVKINLTDGTNTNTAMLGKVQAATQTSAYSTEANSANITTATKIGVNAKGESWFWYVAPDDFSQNNTGIYANLSQRSVTANITTTLVNGTTETDLLTIKIVRPPLMMVHGLGGSSESFEDFHYESGTSKIKFTNSTLFKQISAIDLIPNAAYVTNADKLLSPNDVNQTTSNYPNTLQGNIAFLREEGYAANQVDYVCHSMGGCILRTAMTIYADKFYVRAGFSKNLYKNYGNGFVHKAITINTPHNGSPVADAVTEFIPKASPKLNSVLEKIYLEVLPFPKTGLRNFIKPTYIDKTFEATDAVRNLQVKGTGGVNLSATNVKHHFIAGDVDFMNPPNASNLPSINSYVDLLDWILSIMHDNTPPSPLKTQLKRFMGLKKLERAFTFIEWYSQQKGYTNFLGDGDFIVPLASQLADIRVPSITPSYFRIFPNTSSLSANHLSILDRGDVGNWVKDLLNSSIYSNFFSNTIAAKTNLINPNGDRNTAFLQTRGVLSTLFDTLKVVIEKPMRNTMVFVDSTLELSYRIKDTSNLAYIEYSFQGKSDLSINRTLQQTISMQVNPNFLGKQTIYVTAAYDNETGTDYHIDTLSVNVQTKTPPLGFKVSPKVVTIYKGIPYNPICLAEFETFVANVPVNSPNLSISVNNTNAVSYDNNKHYFIGIDTLTTFATLTYDGFVDTIYFNVIDTTANIDNEIVPSISGLNDSYCKNEPSINLANYGSPAGGIFTIDGETATSLDPATLAVGSHNINYTINDIPSVTVIVEIKNIPSPAITGLNTNYCKNTPIISLSGLPLGGSFTVDGINATTFDPTILDIGSHIVKYAISQNGCSNSVMQQVAINLLPNAQISANGITTFCQGGNVKLTASGGTSYTWSNGAITAEITAIESKTYSVTVTNSSGCSKVVTQSVVINPLPIAAASANPVSILLGESSVLTASGGSTYQWSTNPPGNNSSGKVFPTTSTTYTVTVTSNNGCTSTATTSVTVNIPCTYSINLASKSFESIGGNGLFNLSTTAGCVWSASKDCDWVTLTNSSGNGSNSINYTVATNPTALSRTCTITVNGQIHSIIQGGVPCSYSMSLASKNFESIGGSGSFILTTLSNCTWTASFNCTWITLTNTSGTGSTTINYTVTTNPTTVSRSCVITINGQMHTITQNAAACTYSVSSTSKNFESQGGNGSFNLNTTANCTWTTSFNCNWVTVTNSSGSGSTTINYTVATNPTSLSRSCMITINGQSHTINQNGCDLITPVLKLTDCNLEVPAQTDVKYQWLKGVTLVSTERIYPVTETGVYRCLVTKLNDPNCFKISSILNVYYISSTKKCSLVPVGTDEISGFSKLSIYPNPSLESFFVEFELSELKDMQIKIYNSIGQKVLNSERTKYLGKYKQQIN